MLLLFSERKLWRHEENMGAMLTLVVGMNEMHIKKPAYLLKPEHAARFVTFPQLKNGRVLVGLARNESTKLLWFIFT